jgi:O-antigen ligase
VSFDRSGSADFAIGTRASGQALGADSHLPQNEPMIHVHDAAAPSVERRHPVFAAAPALAAIAVTAFILAPRAAPGLLFVLALTPVIALMARGRHARVPLATLLPATLAAFGCYITANAAWSVSIGQAYGKVLFYWVAVALSCLAAVGMPQIPDGTLRRMQRAAVAALAMGAALLAFEVLTHCLIVRTLFSLVPSIRPDLKHIQVADGWVTAIQPYMLNRNVAALCLTIWPCLLMLRTLYGASGGLRLGLPLLGVATVTVVASDHATSAIGLALGGVAFLGMMRAARTMRAIIVVAWIAATLLAAPIASIAFDYDLQSAAWLPQTARNRIILWGYTANEIRNAPLLGVGVASTRDLDDAREATAVRPEGYGIALRTGRHGHSVFIQTWYELGAAGAVLLLAVGLAAIHALSRLPPPDQPAAFAGFVTAVTIGASSWGMWQTWFMAAYAIWAVLLALALLGAERARSPRT